MQELTPALAVSAATMADRICNKICPSLFLASFFMIDDEFDD